MGKLLLVLMLSIWVATQGISAVTYTVNTTKGGAWFDKAIGVPLTKKMMIESTNYILGIFGTKNTKPVKQVSLFINDVAGAANTTENKIYVSAKHIQEFSGDKKKELSGTIYRQMTLVWLYNRSNAPVSLSNGMADFVRLKAGLKPTDWPVKPGGGKSWNENEYVTARFLQYFDYVQNTFVSELNNKMMTGYNQKFFEDILGLKMVDLWRNYQKNASIVIQN